jgi:hypothetical protein
VKIITLTHFIVDVAECASSALQIAPPRSFCFPQCGVLTPYFITCHINEALCNQEHLLIPPIIYIEKYGLKESRFTLRNYISVIQSQPKTT